MLRNHMNKKKKNLNTPATYQDLIVSNLIQIEAIIRILEKKGITNSEEIIAEVKALKAEMEGQVDRSSTVFN